MNTFHFLETIGLSWRNKIRNQHHDSKTTERMKTHARAQIHKTVILHLIAYENMLSILLKPIKLHIFPFERIEEPRKSEVPILNLELA